MGHAVAPGCNHGNDRYAERCGARQGRAGGCLCSAGSGCNRRCCTAERATRDAAHLLRGPATKPAKESTRDKRTRETREREARAAATPVPAGVVRLAVSPWGQVEVDGAAVGTVPPLTEIMLPQGKHQITIRNEDFPPYSASVQIAPGQPVTLKHKFGS